MGENKKILIIEDDKDLLLLLSNALKREEFNVFGETDGLQGLKVIQEKYFDLILLDLDIPNIEGLAVLKKLRNNEKNKDTPVIIFSNAADVENLSEAMEQGVIHYLTKSDWELEGVIAKVKEVLK